MFRVLTPLVVSASLLTTPAAFASPAPGSSDMGSSANGLVTKLFENPSSTQGSVDAALSSLPLLGSSELPIFGPIAVTPGDIPQVSDQEISEARVVEKREGRWIVASPAMQRNVEVEIRLPRDPAQPAPTVYLLDGVNAPRESGWTANDAIGAFEQDNVTLAMPTQAYASLYTDWLSDDPVVGHAKWESFLTQDLPRALEQEPELNFNGKRAIGGISMGGSSAVQIANLHPGLFDAVIGISGCYSTLDNVGRQITHLTVESRGGDTTNMWGPFGSEEWIKRDVPSSAEGLSGARVFISAGNGILSDDRESYTNDTSGGETFAGGVLEAGVLTCTQRLDAVLHRAGHTNYKTAYSDAGGHNWANFRRQVAPAWDYVKPVLY